MMKEKNGTLDPRTGMILIVISVFIVFSHSKLYIEWIFVGSILLLMYLFKIRKMMIQTLCIYLILASIQIFVIPNVNVTLASILSVFVYFKMIFPCGAMVALCCGTMPVRVILEAFRRMHFSLPITISLAVSARYFPALKEETVAIWNAMRLRNIKGFEQKIEGMYVPLLMSAVQTGEELAQSAIIRGIENPEPKTSLVEIRFRIRDGLALIYFGAIAVLAVVVR